mgnify:CR=1 FL=1
MNSIALVIPSYARHEDLQQVITTALAQTQPFNEIVVALRDDDDASAAIAANHNELKVVTTSQPGVLAAMRAGLRSVTSNLVMFTDDDARLPSDFVARLLPYFDNHAVVGVGGRDILFDANIPRPTSLSSRVGELTPWGRLVGNHHCGTGGVREVAVLKGVNATYRRAELALPTQLRGAGAQPHFEVAVGTRLRARGGVLLYDPELSVEHHPAQRVGDDQRNAPTAGALFDSAFNLERSLPRALMTRRLFYVLFVGDTNVPGVLRAVIALVRGETRVLQRILPGWRGTLAAWRQRATPLAYD